MGADQRLRAGLIYGGGDLVATLIAGTVDPWRTLGMALVGGLLYAPEIGAYFNWLDRRLPAAATARRRWQRAVLGWLWFNPLWIARHALLIRLFSGRLGQIDSSLLLVGLTSFACNLPVALAANYLIQNRLPARRRVVGSALFSALMAVYYALSEVWFG
jgi:hypothetical protein